MIIGSMFFEKFLQECRFKKARPYLIGDVLDFGGNEGELKNLVKGKYTAVNYDHSVLENIQADTIAALAVMEHLNIEEVFEVFQKFRKILRKNGRVILTTPSRMAKPVLESLAFLKIIDGKNIKEHKYYWNRKEIYELAKNTGFIVKKYKKFQFGFNQFAIFE